MGSAVLTKESKMSKTIEVPCGVILTIRRPNGAVERVERTDVAFGLIPAVKFAAMVKATREAGRGELLSQELMTRTAVAAEPTAADLARAQHDADRATIERISATGR